MNELRRKKILLTLVFGLSLAVTLFLASSLPNLRFQPGQSLHLLEWILSLLSENAADLPEIQEQTPRSSLFPDLDERTLISIILLFWLLLIFSILYALVSPYFRKKLIRMFITMFFLVFFIPKIARDLLLQIRMAFGGRGGTLLGENTLPIPPAFIENPPEWLFLVINLLLLLFFFGGFYILWPRLRPKPETRVLVMREVKRALEDLEAGLDFTDVVIACYAKMCQGLQKSRSVDRHHAMTPREFEEHLAHLGIASTHIQQLTRLFESVRYGAKHADKATEQEATQCLQAILQVYGE